MASGMLPTLSYAAAVLLALLLGAAVAIYAYATRHFGYWRRKGVPFLSPLPIVGNLKECILFRKHIGHVLQDVYTNMKDKPYVGMFFFDQPVLFVKDLSLWKKVLHQDSIHFEDRGFAPVKSDKIFSQNLLGVKGPRWRQLRTKLSPAFTQGKLKRFYTLLERKAANLEQYFEEPARTGTPSNVVHACARYAMDAVASVGFGLESRALLDDDDQLHRLLRSVFVYSKVYTLVSFATFVNLPLLRLLGVSLVPPPLAAFLRRTVWGVVAERERDGLRGVRGDFLDLLMELREKGSIAADDDEIPNGVASAPASDAGGRMDMDGDMLISQVFSAFSAGFDTTTSMMGYTLYELAKNQSIQEKLRTQLQKALENHDGKLTYEAVQSVEYLDMIVSESLRKYPPLPFLDRTCTRDYRIPGTDVVLNKGVFAFTSILGIHRDPEFFPDPERFDPERFSEANKPSIPSGAYIPFGDGPHRCIGMRLGTLQGKVGLAHIILSYRVHPCASTPDKMEFDYHSFLIHPRDGVPLKLTRV